ncbi:MAG: hypothetical protein M1821_007760 [Bathelium mastoideum]|nr:MAG: hypothetical protein M1821_007760 [Bathelium mastoideum]
MATAIRQPFGELGTPRLQQLQNVKNRQNAITASHSAPAKSTFTFSSPLKRQHSPTFPAKDGISVFDDNDSENVDPSIFLSPSKRSKNDNGLPVKKPNPTFSLNLTPTQPSSPRPRSTLKATPLRGSTPPPSTRMTTPAGRSPQRQRIGLLSKSRRISAPVKRIDPPTPRSTKSSPALPFSIDAALSGSLSSSSSKPHQQQLSEPAAREPAPKQQQPSMPRSWFFAIYEDTPEQEATLLMEHSACVLDISDDEGAAKRGEDGEGARGKENVPPPDWVAAASQPRSRAAVGGDAGEGAMTVECGAIDVRAVASAAAGKRALDAGEDAMAVDAPPRSPLEDLAPEAFYGEGLDAESVAIVPEGSEAEAKVGEVVVAVEDKRDAATVELDQAVESKDTVLVYESDGAKEP